MCVQLSPAHKLLLSFKTETLWYLFVSCKLPFAYEAQSNSLTYLLDSTSITEPCVFNSVCLAQHTHTHIKKTHTCAHFLYLSLHLSSSFPHWKGGIGWGGMIVLGGSQKTDCLLLSSAHLTLTVTE